MVDSSAWHWVPQNDLGGASGNSLMKLAKNLRVSATAQLAREVVQNSWDAAQVFRKESGHEFKVSFRFVEFNESMSSAIRSKVRGDELREYFVESLGLDPERVSLFGSKSVRALIIEDFGAHGLYGHPDLKNKSILYRALYTLGSTAKANEAAVSGGSYGFGKSAFVSASHSNTVFAYSCFDKFENDPVTRRFVGWTWHNEFELADEVFEGRAIFGDMQLSSAGGRVKPLPFVDDAADEFAKMFSISPRSSEAINSRGTALVLLDPIIDPLSLVEELENNWWPAMVDPEINMHLEVVDFGGAVLHPQPKSREDLKPLIRAYELATQPLDSEPALNERMIEVANQGVYKNVGRIGFVAVEPNDEQGPKAIPKVLMTRGPRMIIGEVEHKFQAKNVEIYAVFATQASSLVVDAALRSREPYSHDRWDYTEEEDPKYPGSQNLAKKIRETLVTEVNKFTKDMSRDLTPESKRLNEFGKLFGKLFGDSKGTQPPPIGQALPVSINFKRQELEAVDGKVRLTQHLEISLRDSFAEESLQISIEPELAVLIDGSSKGDSLTLNATTLPGSIEIKGKDGFYVTTLTRGDKVKLELKSQAYAPDYSVDLRVSINEIGEEK